jgi:hypothetical protein
MIVLPPNFILKERVAAPKTPMTRFSNQERIYKCSISMYHKGSQKTWKTFPVISKDSSMQEAFSIWRSTNYPLQ